MVFSSLNSKKKSFERKPREEKQEITFEKCFKKRVLVIWLRKDFKNGMCQKSDEQKELECVRGEEEGLLPHTPPPKRVKTWFRNSKAQKKR